MSFAFLSNLITISRFRVRAWRLVHSWRWYSSAGTDTTTDVRTRAKWSSELTITSEVSPQCARLTWFAANYNSISYFNFWWRYEFVSFRYEISILFFRNKNEHICLWGRNLQLRTAVRKMDRNCSSSGEAIGDRIMRSFVFMVKKRRISTLILSIWSAITRVIYQSDWRKLV